MLEVGPNCGHEVERIGAAKTAVLALALLIKRIGNDDTTVGRLAATTIEGPEVHHKRGYRCETAAFQVDRG